MSAQSAMQGLAGTVIASVGALGHGIGKATKKGLYSDNKEKMAGKDLEMAKKARKEKQQKINAIYANKELSSKARTRRVGQILDDMGGK